MREITKDTFIPILQYYNIPYWLTGKNVTEDCVAVQCPFCNDLSNHLGIFKDRGNVFCYKCNVSRSFFDYLNRRNGITYQEFSTLIQNKTLLKTSFKKRIEDVLQEHKDEKKKVITRCEIPEFCSKITKDTTSLVLRRFLQKRKIPLDTVIKNNCYLGIAGKYVHRLVVPILYGEKLVSFQGIDLTERGIVKHKTAPGNLNDFLYNYDNIMDTMVLTEGIFDAWRVGDTAVATFGTHITNRQILLIAEKKLRILILAWDEDAYWKSKRIARQLSPFAKKLRIVKFPLGHDPDSYGRDYGTSALHKLIYQTLVL